MIISCEQFKLCFKIKYIYLYMYGHHTDYKTSCISLTAQMCLIITIGSNLTDVNECAINNGGCAGTCVNLIGGYECQCASGYVLSNNISCTGKNLSYILVLPFDTIIHL